jgi:hypothetical protein
MTDTSIANGLRYPANALPTAHVGAAKLFLNGASGSLPQDPARFRVEILNDVRLIPKVIVVV